MASDILVVDDEADIRNLVSGLLEDEGHGTRQASDSDSALAAISDRRPSMIVALEPASTSASDGGIDVGVRAVSTLGLLPQRISEHVVLDATRTTARASVVRRYPFMGT